MTMKGFTRNFKPLEILTEEQVEAIHRGVLDVLENTGVRVEHDRALKLFDKNGCRVDYDEKRVRIPPGLAEECLRKTPSTFRIKARDPKNDLQIGGNTVYFMNSAGMRIADLDTWESRPATNKEQDDIYKVVDAMDNLHLAAPIYNDLAEVPACMAFPEFMASRIRNTSKAIFQGYTLDSEIFTIEMAKAVGINYLGLACSAPPLTLPADACESIYRTTEAGFPIFLDTGTVMGGTGPATIAGSIVTTNAELTAMVVLIQLLRPGTGVLAVDFDFAMDMRGGHPAFGAASSTLLEMAFTQTWRKWGIPTQSGVPGYSSSKKIDFQSGYERAMCSLAAALSGASSVQLHGCIHGELTANPVMLVLDDDIAGMVGRIINGVLVNDETLAIDLIEAVGPIPGMYLDKAHTREWWQKEQFMPKAADRLSYPEWLEKGKKSALDYAKDRVEEILATHQPKPLTASQDEAIERILGEARTYYKKRGLI